MYLISFTKKIVFIITNSNRVREKKFALWEWNSREKEKNQTRVLKIFSLPFALS